MCQLITETETHTAGCRVVAARAQTIGPTPCKLTFLTVSLAFNGRAIQFMFSQTQSKGARIH